MNSLPVPFFDLTRQYQLIRPEVDQAVARVLSSGWYILGVEVAAFEREFAAASGARQAVGVGSGTEALHLALRACGIRSGDEVITTPNTAVPTVSAIESAGARPVFVDIDPATFNLSPDRLRKHLKAQRPPLRVKAVIPVHLYGRPADMGPILEVAREFGLKVIEDAAQAHGSVHGGRKVGTLGDAGCFSFYPTKNLGAFGDAGMVTTDSEEIAGNVRLLRNYGEERKYVNRIRGFNSRLDELQAAVLRAKLGHLEEWVEARRARARQYGELLQGTPLNLPGEGAGDRTSYHLYVVRHPERDRLQRHLREQGIGTAIHYPTPIHAQEAYRDLGYATGDFPEAERACREVLSLPLYPELNELEIRKVCSAIASFR